MGRLPSAGRMSSHHRRHIRGRAAARRRARRSRRVLHENGTDVVHIVLSGVSRATRPHLGLQARSSICRRVRAPTWPRANARPVSRTAMPAVASSGAVPNESRQCALRTPWRKNGAGWPWLVWTTSTPASRASCAIIGGYARSDRAIGGTSQRSPLGRRRNNDECVKSDGRGAARRTFASAQRRKCRI